MKRSLAYRSDIDGLRALAVMAVILFHLDKEWLPGGYVGVDIFFVISGYLISLIIIHEVDQGSFSFAEFYARRFRRLIPALSFVIMSSLVLFHLVFSPGDFIKLVESAIYSQFFVSNVYFAFLADASYFSDDMHAQAFLHLWSLAVEEQFYLFWPMLLFLCLGVFRTGALLIGLLVLVSLSIASGDLLYRFDPMAAYYMLPSRIGEFGIGAFIALLQAKNALPKAINAPWSSAFAMLLGFGLIAWSLIVLEPGSIFPGVNALLPSGGAALVILGGLARPWPARLLGHPIPAFLGRISYSAYLWHWPIIVAIRYVRGDMDLGQKMMAFAATLVLAIITFYLIEQPFRQKPLAFRSAFLRYAAAPGVVLLMFAYGVKATDGQGLFAFSPAFKDQYQRYLSGLHPNYKAAYVCQRSDLTEDDVRDPACITGADLSGEPDILLWGDSKAAHLAGLLGKVGEHTGTTIRNVAHSACAPVMNDPARFSTGQYAGSCARSAEVVWPVVLEYEKVLLSADWAGYLKRADQTFEEALTETLTALKERGVQPALVGEVPTFPKYDRECYVIKMKVDAVDCEERATAPRDLIESVNDRIRKIADMTGTPYFDFNDILCDKTTCYAQIGDVPVYYDRDHLSIDGSVRVGEMALADQGLLTELAAFLK